MIRQLSATSYKVAINIICFLMDVFVYVVIGQKYTSIITVKIWFLILKISYYFLHLRIHFKAFNYFKNKE